MVLVEPQRDCGEQDEDHAGGDVLGVQFHAATFLGSQHPGTAPRELTPNDTPAGPCGQAESIDRAGPPFLRQRRSGSSDRRGAPGVRPAGDHGLVHLRAGGLHHRRPAGDFRPRRNPCSRLAPASPTVPPSSAKRARNAGSASTAADGAPEALRHRGRQPGRSGQAEPGGADEVDSLFPEGRHRREGGVPRLGRKCKGAHRRRADMRRPRRAGCPTSSAPRRRSCRSSPDRRRDRARGSHARRSPGRIAGSADGWSSRSRRRRCRCRAHPRATAARPRASVVAGKRGLATKTERVLDHQRDMGEVAHRVVAQAAVERGRHAMAGDVRHQQRVAVGRRLRDLRLPTVAPAPARFSMITGWPSWSCSPCASSRATRSVVPPGAKGTTRRIGWVGQAAIAGLRARRPRAAPMRRCRRAALGAAGSRTFSSPDR